MVELVDRPHQAEVALLDQVEQLHAPADVALGDAHDEAQVGLDQLALGPLAVAARPASRLRVSTSGEHLAGLGGLVDAGGPEVALLDQLGQAALVVAGQQVDLADLAEVHAHAVGRQRRRSAARALRTPPAPAPAEQVLVGLVERGVVDPLDGRRRLVDLVDVVGLVDGLVERDPRLGQRQVDRRQHVAGQLDVTQDVRDLLGVDAPLLAAPLDERGPLGRVDAVHPGGCDGAVGSGLQSPLRWATVRFPHWRVPPSDDGANLATTPQPPLTRWESPNSSRCKRASASSRISVGIAVAGAPRQLPTDGGGDQVPGLGLGVDVEVGDGRPLEHLAGLGVGGLDGRRQVAVGSPPGPGTPGGGPRRRTAPRPATPAIDSQSWASRATATNSAFSRTAVAPGRR